MSGACVRLRADGHPLRDPRVRATVVAAARALAERTGIEIQRLVADTSGIEVVLSATEAVGVGFAAELRRSTDAWHRGRTGRDLWPAPPGAAPGHPPPPPAGPDDLPLP